MSHARSFTLTFSFFGGFCFLSIQIFDTKEIFWSLPMTSSDRTQRMDFCFHVVSSAHKLTICMFTFFSRPHNPLIGHHSSFVVLIHMKIVNEQNSTYSLRCYDSGFGMVEALFGFDLFSVTVNTIRFKRLHWQARFHCLPLHQNRDKIVKMKSISTIHQTPATHWHKEYNIFFLVCFSSFLSLDVK